MRALADIEGMLLHRLSLLRLGPADAFETIDGFAGQGKARVVEDLRRRRKPAALVSYAGRTRTSSGESFRFSLFVATESLRGIGEPRTGGEGVLGMHRLLDLVRGSLDGTTLPCGVGLTLISEAHLVDDDRFVVFEQKYEIEEGS